MTQPEPTLCGHQYPHPAGSPPNTRIVECQLPAGHGGPHIEWWDERHIGRSEWRNEACCCRFPAPLEDLACPVHGVYATGGRDA